MKSIDNFVEQAEQKAVETATDPIVGQAIDPQQTVVNQPKNLESEVVSTDSTDPVVQQPATDPVINTDVNNQPAEPNVQEPTKENVEKTEPNVIEEKKEVDLDAISKDIDDLLSELDTLWSWKKTPDVNTQEPKIEKEQLDIEEDLAKTDISVDEKTKITNYIDELETQVAQNELSRKTLEVQNRQLEQMLEQERTKTNQLFEKAKELEWEQKKMQSSNSPDELSNFIDYYKLMKDNPSLYNKRNFVWELAKLGEQTTERNLDEYILDWLKSWDSFNKEEPSADIPKWTWTQNLWWDDLVRAISF